MYPKKCTMELMYTILEMIDCTTLLKCSENRKVSSVWIKTPSPLIDSMLYDKGNKEWLKKDIQNVYSQTPCIFRSITDTEAKEMFEL